MRALARFSSRALLFALVVVQASWLSAQQYGPGVVLDPNTLGNLNLIFEREQIYYSGEARRPAPPPPPTWNQSAVSAFRAGNYALAANNWRHALVDAPRSGLYALRLAQAEFALGNYDNAAEALHLAMTLLPQDEWGQVVRNYKRLYTRNRTFTTQLRALELARKENPDNAAIRFLLGFQYLYLGFPQQAHKQLQVANELAPDDLLARDLAVAAAVAGGIPVGDTLSSEVATEEADGPAVPAETPPTSP
ncbi:MAG: hypothetical protein AB7U73_20890 [Pirellulales bacterium]